MGALAPGNGRQGRTTGYNPIALSAYWQPSKGGTWVPSISTGWGYTGFNINGSSQTAAAQSWYVGLQWADAFVKGNAAGFAFGQPTFVTQTPVANTFPNDAGYAFEAWYKFQVTDHISVTPAVFYLTNPLGQGVAGTASANTYNGNALNNFGMLVKTTFKF